MLRIAIEHTSQGMVLAQPVADPEKLEHTLLNAGFTLETNTIRRLKELKVPHVWIQYPDLDFLDERIDPAILKNQQELYGALKENFADVQQQNLAKMDYMPFVQMMTTLFNNMLKNGPASALIGLMEGADHDLFAHGVMVSSLALAIGMQTEGYLVRQRSSLPPHLAADMTQLGVGALLHDLGKQAFPDELKSFHLTAHDMGTAEWQAHTEAGFEMLRGGLDATAAQVVINHHQHFDGSGFPARKPAGGDTAVSLPLHGESIHIFCRITAMADRFVGLRSLPDGTLGPPIVGIKRLRNPGYIRWFDPVVYEAFVKTVMPFTLGDQVTLNNGKLAAVIGLNPAIPCRPIVRCIDLAKACDAQAQSKAPAPAAEDEDKNENQEAAPQGDSAANATQEKPQDQPQKEQPDQSQDDTPAELQGEDVIDLAARADVSITHVGNFDVTPFLF